MRYTVDPIVSCAVSKYKSGFTTVRWRKLAADPAPSGGIHSCTLRDAITYGEMSERYGITIRLADD